MRRSMRAVAVAALLIAGSAVTAVVAASPAHAATICEDFGTQVVGNYIVMNNKWNGSAPQQCINTTATGFQITQSNANVPTNGAPAAYPAIYAGCHYTVCSPGTTMPRQISQIGSVPTSISYSLVSGATYNASFDIWLDPTPRTNGVNQTEIMIWFTRQGSIQPIGSSTGNATVAGRTWDVWQGNNGSNNVVSYVASAQLTSWSFDVMAFVNDTISRGRATTSWYLTSVQAGFEPWIGGAGLAVTDFSSTISTGGGGGDVQAPSAPGQPTASNITANSVGLSWAASTDNVGVVGYDVFQSTGGTATQIGTTAGTSFNATGLSAGTAYTFTVRARDAANNVSAFSAGRSVTTLPGGGGTGGCTATYRLVNSWSGGFQGEVTVRNTGTTTISGWTTTWSASDVVLTAVWNGRQISTSPIIVVNESYNGSLGANASTTYGFTARGSGTPTMSCTTS